MIQHVAETDLVRLVKEGNRTAMRELYDRHIRYLTGVAARYVDDGELRDVLQESFVKIYSSICRFEHRGAGSLRAWLTRIVVNVRTGKKNSAFFDFLLGTLFLLLVIVRLWRGL